MAVKTLAVMYRPMSFADVVEQGSVKAILSQQLKSKEVKNAYLFCGGAGTGKTTCARIFANEINNHQGNPIEMDAASNSSVDDVREIIQQAKTKSLDSEYKVFIIDECFPANTLVQTTRGNIPISEITTSDYVLSMSGLNSVTHLFKNRVLTSRLCCVMIGDRKIITTVEHLFFTNHGWVCAKDLQEGDIVYAYNVSKDLSSVRERVSSAEQSQGSEVLLQQLCNEIPVCSSNNGTAAEGSTRNTNMPNVWKSIYGACNRQSEDLLKEMRNGIRCEVIFTVDEYRIWDGETETVIRKNVAGQPDESSRDCGQDADNQIREWDSASVAHNQGWKWEVHDSTDSIVASIRRWLGIRICNQHKEFGLARTSTTLVLQSRPWLFSEDAGSRGRWSFPQVERPFIEGCEEDGLFTATRVDRVEVYKRGDNDKLFLSSFADTELSGEYVTMYDLEVENDHCYTANDILVHNCHSISNTGWQAFLKLIEEPPAKSIFIFCTTDPQKIPKTILSRVQRYDFQRISHEGIKRRLVQIIQTERCNGNDFYIEPDACDYIAKLADGGMRDAITLMDKCLAFNSRLTVESVVKALGTVDYETMFNLTDAIIKNDSAATIKIIESVHFAGKDLKQFIKLYTNFILDLCKYDCTKDYAMIEIPNTYSDRIDKYNKHSYDEFRRLLSELVSLNASIKWETAPKPVIEAVLVLHCREVEL